MSYFFYFIIIYGTLYEFEWSIINFKPLVVRILIISKTKSIYTAIKELKIKILSFNFEWFKIILQKILQK